MPTYYVDKSDFKEHVPAKGHFSELDSYELVLKNAEGTWEADFAQGTGKPPLSGTVNGTITSSQFGNRFKLDKGTSGNPRQGVTEYTSGKTPEQQKSIVRQHSQHMALIYIALVQKKEPEVSLNREYVTKMIDWFQEDAEGA